MGTDMSARAAVLRVRVGRALEMFNTLDPYPFGERDLDPAAEDYLVAWVKDEPRGKPLRVEILVPPDEAAGPEARALPGAVRHHFEARAAAVGRELRETLRIGRIALMIGVPILGLSLLAAKALNDADDHRGFLSVLAEGLVIAGWVANWRPIEIFLYDWWPILRRRRRFERLARADIAVIADGSAPPAAA